MFLRSHTHPSSRAGQCFNSFRSPLPWQRRERSVRSRISRAPAGFVTSMPTRRRRRSRSLPSIRPLTARCGSWHTRFGSPKTSLRDRSCLNPLFANLAVAFAYSVVFSFSMRTIPFPGSAKGALHRLLRRCSCLRHPAAHYPHLQPLRGLNRTAAHRRLLLPLPSTCQRLGAIPRATDPRHGRLQRQAGLQVQLRRSPGPCLRPWW